MDELLIMNKRIILEDSLILNNRPLTEKPLMKIGMSEMNNGFAEIMLIGVKPKSGSWSYFFKK